MKLRSTAFLLTFFVSILSYGQLKIEDLKIDTTITSFQFAADWSGTMVYTPNGKSDLKTINPSAFSFTLYPNATYKAAIQEIDNLILMSTQNGYIHSDVIRRDTIINGYKALFISFTETQNGTNYKNFVFDAIIMKDNTAIIFVSGDLDNGKYIEKFKKTFYSIKL